MTWRTKEDIKTRQIFGNPRRIRKINLCMKNMLFLLLFFLGACDGWGQLVLTPGAQFSLTGSTHLTLQNTDFINNGNFTTGTSIITFLGNVTTTISGSQPTHFFELEMNKSNGSSVKLQKSIDVAQRVLLTAGFLDLNGFDTDLGTTGHLDGERDNSRIIGPAGGEVLFNVNLNAPIASNPANLGIFITANQNLGNVMIKRGHQSQAINPGGLTSVQRYFDIIPSNNTNINATLRFKYFDGELNGLDENALSFFQSQNLTTWSNLGFDSRDTVSDFVIGTGINSFSRFTLSAIAIPLAVRFGLVNAKCDGGKVVITWKTLQEQNSSYFNVERTTDGIRWTVIDKLPADGNSTTENRYSITDNTPIPNAYYRIAQYDHNGSVEYTSAIRSSCIVKDLFSLRPNPTRDKLFISIVTTSESQAIIKLFDSKGALMKVATTSLLPGSNQFSFDIGRMANGFYQLSVDWNNGRSVKTLHVLKH